MTMHDQGSLRRATAEDIDDIVGLLQANEQIRGGTLTGHFDATIVMAALDDMPVIVARRLNRLAGVLISSSISGSGHGPVITQMLRTYRGDPDAYLYGPICIDQRDRGHGLPEQLFTRLKTELPRREGILFIRRDNEASIRAHQGKLGMETRGVFAVDGIEYIVLAYHG